MSTTKEFIIFVEAIRWLAPFLPTSQLSLKYKNRFYSDMPTELLQFLATCQFRYNIFSESWRVAKTQRATVGMSLKIQKILAVLTKSAYSKKTFLPTCQLSPRTLATCQLSLKVL
jgi:hypothetical protein